MALSPVMVELKAGIGEFKAKMLEARMEVQKLADEGGKNHEKMAAVGKAAFLGLAGAALAVGLISVKAAMEGQVAHAALAQAVKNTGSSMETLEPAIARGTKAFAALGFTRDQYEQGLASMTTSLGSATKATGAMGLAADLARFKHIDLTTASIAVAKAMEGQLRPLKQLGIDLPVAAGGARQLEVAHANLVLATEKLSTFVKIHKDALDVSSKSHGVYLQMVDKVRAAHEKLTMAQGAAIEITKALSDRIGGQASAQAATFSGKLDSLKANFQNLAETIGNKLIPILSTAMDFVMKNKTAFEALALIVGGALVGAAAAFVVGFVIANGVAIAIGVAVAAVIVIFKKCWDSSETFRNVMKLSFDMIKLAVLGFVLAAVDVFGTLLRVWLNVAGGILSGAATAFGWIPGVGDKLKGASTAFNSFKDSALGTIDGFRKGLVSTMASTAQDAASKAQAIGSGIADGITVGMQNRQMSVYAMAAGMGHGAAMAAKAGAGVQSPSYKTHYVGQMIASGLVSGMRAGRAAAMAEARMLARNVADAIQDSKQSASDILFTAMNLARSGVALLATEVAKLQSKLDGLKAARATLSNTVSSGVTTGMGNAATLFANSTDVNPEGDVVWRLKSQLSLALTFGNQLKELSKAGASKELIAQVAGQGAEAGGKYAAALLAQGSTGVKAVSSLMAQIAQAGRSAGDAVAGEFYNQGINSTQAVVNGMRSREALLKAQVARIRELMRDLRGAPSIAESNWVAGQGNRIIRVTNGLVNPPPAIVNVFIDGQQVHSAVQQQQSRYVARNGRSAF